MHLILPPQFIHRPFPLRSSPTPATMQNPRYPKSFPPARSCLLPSLRACVPSCPRAFDYTPSPNHHTLPPFPTHIRPNEPTAGPRRRLPAPHQPPLAKQTHRSPHLAQCLCLSPAGKTNPPPPSRRPRRHLRKTNPPAPPGIPPSPAAKRTHRFTRFPLAGLLRLVPQNEAKPRQSGQTGKPSRPFPTQVSQESHPPQKQQGRPFGRPCLVSAFTLR